MSLAWARHVSHVSARKRDKICLTTLFFSHPSALVLFQPISLTLMQVTVHSFCLLSKSSPNKSWDERGINQEHFCYSVFVHKSRVSATSLKFTGHKYVFSVNERDAGVKSCPMKPERKQYLSLGVQRSRASGTVTLSLSPIRPRRSVVEWTEVWSRRSGWGARGHTGVGR